MARPRVLLLDEPSLGLSPLLVQSIFATIRRINSEGSTVLLVDQSARAALRLAHRGYVIGAGEVVMEGSADVLLGDPRLAAAYLGTGACTSRPGHNWRLGLACPAVRRVPSHEARRSR